MMMWMATLKQTYTARRSLRFRVTLGVTLALAVIIVIFIVLHYQADREQMLHEAEANLANVAQVIEGSLEHAMTTRDFAEL